MKNCTLYLVRHGESLSNSKNVVGGHLDSVLTDKGRAEALTTKQLLKKVHFDDAYSSDLIRAIETAEIIYGKKVPPSHQLFDLRERTFGKLEGRPDDEWHRLDNEYNEKYSKLPFNERLKYNYADFIESDKQLLTRTIKSLRTIAKKHQKQTVLVAIHGGNIRMLLMWLGYAQLISAGSFANAGYVVLTSDGRDFKIQRVVGVDKDAQGAE